LKAYKIKSVLPVHAPIVGKFFGCLIEQKTINKDVLLYTLKTLSDFKNLTKSCTRIFIIALSLVDFFRCPPLIIDAGKIYRIIPECRLKLFFKSLSVFTEPRKTLDLIF
jgi:hypothetical protein